MNDNKAITEAKVILPADPFEVMDRMDDELIMKEIEGRIVDTWVYHFTENGKEQWGLSKVGVDAACAELAKRGEVIRELDMSYQVDPTDKEYVLFQGKAGRYAVGRDGREVLLDTAIGTKRQCLKVERRDGQGGPNRFWFEQGSMKAMRNARTRLIDEEIRTKIVTFAKQGNKIKEVTVEGSAREIKPESTGSVENGSCPECHCTIKNGKGYHKPGCPGAV